MRLASTTSTSTSSHSNLPPPPILIPASLISTNQHQSQHAQNQYQSHLAPAIIPAGTPPNPISLALGGRSLSKVERRLSPLNPHAYQTPSPSSAVALPSSTSASSISPSQSSSSFVANTPTTHESINSITNIPNSSNISPRFVYNTIESSPKFSLDESSINSPSSTSNNHPTNSSTTPLPIAITVKRRTLANIPSSLRRLSHSYSEAFINDDNSSQHFSAAQDSKPLYHSNSGNNNNSVISSTSSRPINISPHIIPLRRLSRSSTEPSDFSNELYNSNNTSSKQSPPSMQSALRIVKPRLSSIFDALPASNIPHHANISHANSSLISSPQLPQASSFSHPKSNQSHIVDVIGSVPLRSPNLYFASANSFSSYSSSPGTPPNSLNIVPGSYFPDMSSLGRSNSAGINFQGVNADPVHSNSHQPQRTNPYYFVKSNASSPSTPSSFASFMNNHILSQVSYSSTTQDTLGNPLPLVPRHLLTRTVSTPALPKWSKVLRNQQNQFQQVNIQHVPHHSRHHNNTLQSQKSKQQHSYMNSNELAESFDQQVLSSIYKPNLVFTETNTVSSSSTPGLLKKF